MRASGKSALHPLTYTLDEPSQGSVAVVLTLPRGRYCVDSGGLQCETDADCLPPTPGSCQDTVLRMRRVHSTDDRCPGNLPRQGGRTAGGVSGPATVP